MTKEEKGKEAHDIARDLVRHFGEDLQILKAIEELSELIQALAKVHHYDDATKEEKDRIRDEVIDVEIMIEQIKFIYGFDNYHKKKIKKKLELRKKFNL